MELGFCGKRMSCPGRVFSSLRVTDIHRKIGGQRDLSVVTAITPLSVSADPILRHRTPVIDESQVLRIGDLVFADSKFCDLLCVKIEFVIPSEIGSASQSQRSNP